MYACFRNSLMFKIKEISRFSSQSWIIHSSSNKNNRKSCKELWNIKCFTNIPALGARRHVCQVILCITLLRRGEVTWDMSRVTLTPGTEWALGTLGTSGLPWSRNHGYYNMNTSQCLALSKQWNLTACHWHEAGNWICLVGWSAFFRKVINSFNLHLTESYHSWTGLK